MGGVSRTGDIVSFGPFRLAAAERLLLKDDAPVAIGGRAFDILIALTERAGQVVSARELIDLVWPDVTVEEANLRVNIAVLRKALGESKGGVRYIVNVPGRGYSFVAAIGRAAADDARPLAAAGTRPQSLPALPGFLVGRGEAVAILSAALGSRRFVSVVGPGGIGKTTVAVAVAHALREDFGDDSVCFVDLGSLTDPADVPSAIASALGCFVQGPDPEPYIRTFLAGKRILIVLDNCEHVIAAAAPLAERLFRGAPSLHLLITSREALRVAGESVHLLTPLDSPPDDAPSAAAALASPAVQLFMEKAGASGYEAELSDAEAPIVAKICRRLDGVALAIELVASRVGAYGIGGTADLLDRGAELLLPGRRSALPRHQSLQAMLDWSFRLLSPDEQRILARLSVFAGPFTLAAAQAVVGDGGAANAIAGLVDKSLIWLSSASEPAYCRLLDTTRAYAAARLAESGEADAMARRHALYFVGFLKSAADASAFDGRNGAVHAPLMGNVRKALAWSFSAAGDRAIGIDLAAKATPLFLEFSLFAESQQWCERALAALRDGDRGTYRELDIQEALAMSSMYAIGKIDDVTAAIERGLALCESLGDGRRQLNLLASLNVVLTRRGDFDGVLAVAKRHAALAEATGGAAEKVLAEWMLGTSYHQIGDQAAALRHCELGFELASVIIHARFNLFYETRTRFTFARALWLCGFPDRGCKVALAAIGEAARHSDHLTYCAALVHSIPVLLWSGDHARAAEPIESAIAQAGKYSLPTFRILALALKGEHMLGGDDSASGVEILRGALEAMIADQYNVVRSPTARALAEGLLLLGRPDEALTVIDEEIARAGQVGEVWWLPVLRRTRGEILLALPRPDAAAAEDALRRAIDLARAQSALSWELRAAIPLARLWSQHGRAKEARAMLQGVYRQFTEGFETVNLVAARALLADIGAAN
ncbi:MAG: winged helix-turn-helix domain-containing protein [Rhizomicrobium sp.]